MSLIYDKVPVIGDNRDLTTSPELFTPIRVCLDIDQPGVVWFVSLAKSTYSAYNYQVSCFRDSIQVTTQLL